MSKHWCPDSDVARPRPKAARREWTHLRSYLQDELKQPLPDGGKAGLALLAAACLGAAIGLYALAGPSDVFERSPSVDWNAVDDAARR